MPSLFSRSRTHSTPNKNSTSLSPDDSIAFDEFGRVSSRSSNLGVSIPSKKDKKRAKEEEKRLRTLSNTRERADFEQSVDPPHSPIPDGSFLPLNLERPRGESGTVEEHRGHDYGYLSYERHVVLGLEQVARLVEVLSEELGTRGGITTPFIFSSTALDLSPSAIKRLIRAFLNTCVINPGHAADEAQRNWREEARFAGPHELGITLRWGLARVVRSVGGQDVRGLVSWDHYVDFRESEVALGYPPAHFATFLQDLAPPLHSILITVLTLLSRLTANSTTSGHTPPTLSPLFGPLFFGLGPATLAFHHVYIHYLWAVNAMEHILLAFIRWQDSPSGGLSVSGSAAALGVPTRLKEWIKGYPSMLPFLQERKKNDKPQPRRGARTVRIMSVRRNVRMYSSDLVKIAATWAHGSTPGAGVNENGLAASKEWDRIAPATLKLPPRYSEAYKKRMVMPPNFHPDFGPGLSAGSPGMSATSSTTSYASTASSAKSGSLLPDSDYFGLEHGAREGEGKFRSLTDLKWGEFESMGFSGLGDEKKLQFDLTESARSERSTKRSTLSWNDFSSSGFTRSDAPLSATLQFSTPVAKTISSWPAHNAEISKKIKKTQKTLPVFGWDTEPIVGNEEVIEEAFVDVFCDLVYGGGWMDMERGEELDRDNNWALVEFKSLPQSRTTVAGGADPRTATTLILFVEFVPLEYRQQLALPSSTRRRLPSLFPSSKSKQWKQAATLNGRPYVVGHVPRSPSYRELEFEGLLRGGTGTKVISLGAKNSTRHPPTTITRVLSTTSTAVPEVSLPSVSAGASAGLSVLSTDHFSPGRSDETHSDFPVSPSMKRMSRFRLPGGIPVPSPGGIRKAGMAPSQYSTVEFETRLASYSDDEYNGGTSEPESAKQKRRESKDDAWVDILVGSHNRRMGGQDAELKDGEKRRGIRGRRSDPDMASFEVARVLAAVRDRSPSPPSVTERVDRDYGMDHMHDLDVDEIQTVPRTSEARSTSIEDSDQVEVDHSAEQVFEPEEPSKPEEPPILTAKQLAKQQRRLGYFDLHPERRPIQHSPVEEDPRDRLAHDSDDEAGDDDIYGPPEPIEPQRPNVPVIRKLPTPPEPPRPVQSPPKIEIHMANGHSGAETEQERALPSANGNGNTTFPHKPAIASRTAALIELYRERERGTPPKLAAPVPIPAVLPVPPSRLPVRSLPLPTVGTPPLIQASAPSQNPEPEPSPLEPPLVELTQVPIKEARTSPEGYVHGTPLHNVLEEEEEED